MKNLMMTLSLALLTTGAYAAPEKFIVETVEVQDFHSAHKGMDVAGAGSGAGVSTPKPGVSLDQVGQVIAVAKDIVALGESIYTLVQKGKPSNTTDFTPISVVPRDPITKEIADPFEMESCSMPVQKKFVTSIKSAAGGEGVRFEYMVIYTYGCSYNGTGKYIQNAIVQPVSVKTSYGWDFNATMKLNGIMNHGTKAQPVVGALLSIKYSMNSWHTAFERNDTIHITANGELKNYSN
jgi:hypothetical protein